MEELKEFLNKAVEGAKKLDAEARLDVYKLAQSIVVLISKVMIWQRNGQKTFLLSKELLEAFQHTDVPLESFPSDFKYPFNVFLIESEIPMFEVKTKMGDRQVFSILYLNAELVDMSNIRFITDDGMQSTTLKWQKGLTAFYPADEFGVENMVIHMRDSDRIIDSLEENAVGYGMSPIDKDDLQNLVNIFYNTVMYINDPERNREETEVRCSRSTKLGSGRSSVLSSYIKLNPPKSYVPLNATCGKGRTIDVRFIVRGHWRNQLFGEKRTFHKHIWIKPYYKGPDFGEIINKPYKVE
ncbi:MAG: hypothetical protein HQK96_06970 [Nitrospirae bacterium]|nr:hypothetical protein [Nitrospirota bacterium]